MSILIGSTGYVGSTLLEFNVFDQLFHSQNIESIRNLSTELLICAGLPAEKWKANQNPIKDWANMIKLASALSTVTAKKAILISTVDVYQPPFGVDENSLPNYAGVEAYGTNRSWFELFFKSHFEDATIVRLPGLFSFKLRKNFIHDLMHDKHEQILKVNKNSEFQFFNMEKLWSLLDKVMLNNIKILNVSSEPIKATEIAGIFGKQLGDHGNQIKYDMKSIHVKELFGQNDYLYSKQEILDDLIYLRDNFKK